MPVETPEIIAAAEKLGQLVSQHPAVAKYKDAQKTVSQDAETSRLMGDFSKQIESLARQEQSGMGITDAQRQQLEALQSRIASNIKVKALNMAEVEFTDLLRKVSQTWQKPLADASARAPKQIAVGNPMAYWLLKTEPSTYSYADLEREKKAVWDGISNATALIHLRNMKSGDLAIVYHTGSERSAVGIAEIASDPYPDPKANDRKLVVVEIKPKKKLAKPVTLDQIKADPTFAGWDLLRIGRLSVVPVSPKIWKRMEELSKG